MQDIKHRELKMQEARKNTPWREFVKEIGSRYWLLFYKSEGAICKPPWSDRIKWVIKSLEFEQYRETLLDNWVSCSGNFFEDIQKLSQLSLSPTTDRAGNNQNSEYADSVYNTKNIYLTSIAIYDCENVLYSFHVKENCHNIFNSVMVRADSNNIYQWIGIIQSQYIFYSKYIVGSSNIWFSTNLNWCDNCILCNWLQNKSFCIHNKQYSQEIYEKKKKEILQEKRKFYDYFLSLENYGHNFWSKEISWSFLINSNDISSWYLSYQMSEGNNAIFVWWKWLNQKIYDTIIWWSPTSNDLYGTMRCGGDSQNIYNSSNINNCFKAYYSYGLIWCSYCLGCIGLKNKSFCILNKQYTKEERYEKANKIFAQMDAEWTLWQFFPWSMNPFYFNDTAAYLIDDSFTKEEVTAQWYLRRDEEIKVDIPAWAEIVKTSELNQYQWRKEIPPTPLSKGGNEPQANGGIKKQRWINPEILKKVIVDEKWNSYRIIKMEYDFLMKHWLPLPEIHWLERIKLGFKFK
jgi:hypothetical protein